MKLTFAVDIDGTITENGDGRIHLDALSSLRDAESAGHNVIFVTGRSSIEGYILAMFAGTTKFCIGENGGCLPLETMCTNFWQENLTVMRPSKIYKTAWKTS